MKKDIYYLKYLVGFIRLLLDLDPKIFDQSLNESITSIERTIFEGGNNDMDKIDLIEQMCDLLSNQYQRKKSYEEIYVAFNDLKKTSDPYNFGIESGWINSFLYFHPGNVNDYPYHFKFGIGHHKGKGDIEEHIILRDGFNMIAKVEQLSNILIESEKYFKNKKNEIEPKTIYEHITTIKIEICLYSRLSIITFFSFIEAFVNSIGYSFLKMKEPELNSNEINILLGKNDKNGYLTLKTKMEKFQKLIRADRKAIINLTDQKQIRSPFKDFFLKYEEIRNSSVHYSPIEEKIWMAPQEWSEIALNFSKISVDVGLLFWKACFPNSNGPRYLGELNYELLKKNAVTNFNNLNQIVNGIKGLENEQTSA